MEYSIYKNSQINIFSFSLKFVLITYLSISGRPIKDKWQNIVVYIFFLIYHRDNENLFFETKRLILYLMALYCYLATVDRKRVKNLKNSIFGYLQSCINCGFIACLSMIDHISCLSVCYMLEVKNF